MKKSQIKSLVREAIDTKLAKKSLREGVMSELDILAQESNTFKEFLGKVKADPTYKSFDGSDREVINFLLALYNDSTSLDEAVAYRSLDESIMGDIDILAQKSNSFEDFLRRVKRDPEIQKAMEGAPLDDSEIKEFLRDMWNDVEERGDEGRGSSGYLEESIGADIDIIAQESTDFADFLNNVMADPTYKNVLDINDPQTKEFLQSIFDEAK